MSEDRFTMIKKVLGDRSYDRRKRAAMDLEILIRQHRAAKEEERVKAILNELASEFMRSPNPNFRKGGLIGMAAAAIGLVEDTRQHLEVMLPPVLHCFDDSESRVRYYACESLFNIAKVARGAILPFFSGIFDGLCKLFTDEDLDVKNGAQLLDRLVKEIVTESEQLDVERFMPLFQKYMSRVNPYVRQLLIGWITVLDSVPDIDMLEHLPRFLDGLFNMLSDSNHEIRQQAEQALGEFLRTIENATFQELDVDALVHILVSQCGSKERAARLTAISWVHCFVRIGGQHLAQLYPVLLDAVLHCSADVDKDVRRVAAGANADLLALVRRTESEVDLRALVARLTRGMASSHVPTRIASLRWVDMLMEKGPHAMQPFMDDLFPALCGTLGDDSDDVVLLDLEVLARVALNDTLFQKMLARILEMFASDRRLLERRGSVVVRNLCVHLDAQSVFTSLADVLADQEDLEFASVVVQTLSLILLTAPELADLRARLKNSTGAAASDDDKAMFKRIFKSWCHNPVSTLSLCLLAQGYHLASALVAEFAELEVSLGLLLQLDKLVHLLESPIFIHLRLQLLQPEYPQHSHLLRALYGLLMLLPQSAAFNTLRNRLNSVTSLHVALARSGDQGASESGQDEDLSVFLNHFHDVQAKHAEARRRALAQRSLKSGSAGGQQAPASAQAPAESS